MSERGWGRVWHGHSLPAGTAPPVPSARRGGEEDEEEDVAAAPPALRCAARLRARRSAAAPAPAGQGLSAAPGDELRVPPFPALPKVSPVRRAAVPGVPRQSSFPCSSPELAESGAGGTWLRECFRSRSFPQTALCPPRSPPGIGEQPSGKFFQGRPRVWFL